MIVFNPKGSLVVGKEECTLLCFGEKVESIFSLFYMKTIEIQEFEY